MKRLEIYSLIFLVVLVIGSKIKEKTTELKNQIQESEADYRLGNWHFNGRNEDIVFNGKHVKGTAMILHSSHFVDDIIHKAKESQDSRKKEG